MTLVTVDYGCLFLLGSLLTVAGQKGFCHYSFAREKWKVFGNEAQERDITVSGGIFWWKVGECPFSVFSLVKLSYCPTLSYCFVAAVCLSSARRYFALSLSTDLFFSHSGFPLRVGGQLRGRARRDSFLSSRCQFRQRKRFDPRCRHADDPPQSRHHLTHFWHSPLIRPRL